MPPTVLTLPTSAQIYYIIEEYSRETGELNYAWYFGEQEPGEERLLKLMRANGDKFMYSMFTHVQY